MKAVALQSAPRGGYTSPDDPGEIGMDGKPRGSVTDAEAAILAQLVAGKDVLEIGTGLGVSAKAMAKTAKSVLSIDIDPWVIEHVRPSVAAAGVMCASEIPRGQRFDVAFIDGNHERESTRDGLKAALPALRRPGLLVLHDMHLDGVRLAARDCDLAVFLLDTPLHLGLVVVRS